MLAPAAALLSILAVLLLAYHADWRRCRFLPYGTERKNGDGSTPRLANMLTNRTQIAGHRRRTAKTM